jgi:hypothetical protein
MCTEITRSMYVLYVHEITIPASFLNQGVRGTVFCVMHLVDGTVSVVKKFTWSGNPSRATRFTAVGFCLLKQISSP